MELPLMNHYIYLRINTLHLEELFAVSCCFYHTFDKVGSSRHGRFCSACRQQWCCRISTIGFIDTYIASWKSEHGCDGSEFVASTRIASAIVGRNQVSRLTFLHQMCMFITWPVVNHSPLPWKKQHLRECLHPCICLQWIHQQWFTIKLQGFEL